MIGFYLDAYQPAAEDEAEAEAAELFRQSRDEAERPVVVAHAAEAGDGDDPCSVQRCDVEAVAVLCSRSSRSTGAASPK